MEAIRRWIEFSGLALELIGVAVIVIGAAVATVMGGWRLAGAHFDGDLFQSYRSALGRGILLGLEFLVAGDIINTVAVEPTYYSVGVLAIVVAIRTFLSFTLELEMNGRWPWQRR